jgi:hypothetical protein
VIPDIGIIVGIYAFVRLCEIATSADTRWTSKSAMALTKALAVCALFAVAFLTVDVAMNGNSALQQLGSPQIFNPPTHR